MPTAVLRYVTGTGNTERAARTMAAELCAAGWTATARELRVGSGHRECDRTADLFVLLFPVLGFGMPTLARRLLRGLRGRGRPAAVFATWGGHALGALGQAVRFLRRGGFRVLAAEGTVYPFNWTEVHNPTAPHDAGRLVDQGDAYTRDFALRLHASFAGAIRITAPAKAQPRYPILSAIAGPLAALLYRYIGRFGLAACFAADRRCNACGRCVKDCPAGSIVLAGKGPSRRPRWRARCEGCNRCINTCPEQAIQCSPLRVALGLVLHTAAIVGVVAGLNALARLLGMPPYVTVPVWIALFVLIVGPGSRPFFALLDRPLFALESLPGPRRLLDRAWTVRFRRYRCAE